ncbi:MAG: hypothetical protein KH156_11330, partial [Alistipes sp.]|nr:hypothetical protein [Alistipes sp.]
MLWSKDSKKIPSTKPIRGKPPIYKILYLISEAPFFRQPVPLPASHTRKGGQQKPKRAEDPKKTP